MAQAGFFVNAASGEFDDGGNPATSGLCARPALSISMSAITTASIILFTGNAIVCEICEEENSGPGRAATNY
jgi:hypothetical protein